MALSAIEKNAGLTRRQFLRFTGRAGLAAAGLLLYAGEISRHELETTHHTITINRLPDAFKGFRIVQISDLHYREYSEAFFIRHVVRTVNKLRPDLIALTGDFTSYGPVLTHLAIPWANECVEMLSHLECPQRYAVLGNHDCMAGQPALFDILTSHGIPVLENRAVAIERDGQRIWLAGVADALRSVSPLPDFDKAVPKAARVDKEPVILMAHEPDTVPLAARLNVDLMLSGHTHGGQVRLPFLPPAFLPELGRNYLEGHFRVGPTQLYVNRGIGAVNLPFRFNCPPEITVFTLA